MDYLYNGIPLPNVNEVWTDDLKAEYPNAAITLASGIYYFSYYSTTPTANQHGVIAGASGRTYQETSGESTWTKSSAVTALTPRKPVWSNYDIYYADDVADVGGTLYLAASDPVPVGKPITDPVSFMMDYQIGCRMRMQRAKPSYQWETLFEGEVQSREEVDTDPDKYLGAARITMTYPGFSVGERIRLTINGESTVLTAVYQYSEESMATYPVRRKCVYVGNSDIGGGSNNGFENQNVIDYDYCLLQYNVYEGSTYIPAKAEAYLYTRSEGTYSVKIERAIPIAYGYNGVQLPGLPVVEGYPYAVILHLYSTDEHYVIFSNEPIKVESQNDNELWAEDWENGYKYQNGTWVEHDFSYTMLFGRVVWGNHDVYSDNGTLYLSKSEPIPVYE